MRIQRKPDKLQISSLRLLQANPKTELDKLGCPAWIIDRARRYVALNDACRRYLKRPLHDIIGRRIEEVFHDDSAGFFDEEDDRALFAARKPARQVISLVEVDNRARWFQTIKTALYGNNGKVVGILGVALDITELRNKESDRTNRLESLERFRALFDQLPIGVAVADANGNVTAVNDGFCAITQRTRARLIGRPLLQSQIHSSNESKLLEILRTLRCSPRREAGGYLQLVRTDGTLTQARLSGRAILDDSERIVSIVAVLSEDSKEAALSPHETPRQLPDEKLTISKMLSFVENHREELKESVTVNVERNIRPLLNRLRKDKNSDQNLINELEQAIEMVFSPFTQNSIKLQLNLTPTELRICKFILAGHTAKEIADILHISFMTVNEHKMNIRRKLKLPRSVNLRMRLEQLSDQAKY